MKKVDFSKILISLIAIAIFLFGIYAGIAYMQQVTEYYKTIQFAIENGREYINIYQPDPTLAVTCVTSLLASFLTYCVYNGALKMSLNKNGLECDQMTGKITRIPNPMCKDINS